VKFRFQFALPAHAAWRHLLLSAFLIAALAACSTEQREEDGDKEPKMGDYSVTLASNSEKFEVSSGSVSTDLRGVGIRVECLGHPDLISSDCATFNPAWGMASSFPQKFFNRIFVEDSSKAQTTFSVEFSTAAIKSIRPNSVSGYKISGYIAVAPRRVPKGLALTGNGRIAVEIFLDGGTEEREIPTAEQAQMTIMPDDVGYDPFTSNTPPLSTPPIKVNYKGPKAELSASLTGLDAARFSVFVQGGLPQQLSGDGGGPEVIVTWIGPGPNPGHGTQLILKTKAFRDADATTAVAQIHL